MPGTPVYRRSAPPPELRPWLASLWIQQSPAVQAAPTRVLPRGQTELIVCYGDAFVHLQDGAAVRVPPVAALGQRTRPILAAATGATGLVIAGLHPWAGDALLGDELGGLTDRMVDLADVVGRPRVASLRDRVATAVSEEERLSAVEAFLRSLFRRHEPDPLVAACARRINRTGGRLAVDGLAAELRVSGRHLRRRFARAVGIGPKAFSRLVRAQRALSALRLGWHGARVAVRCGYVDQAHLTRELKQITGRTPGALQGAEGDTPLMRAFNRRDRAPFPSTVYL